MKGVSRMDATNFEEKAMSLHGPKYDYSKVHYTGANSKVTIICSVHGEYEQTPSKHVNMKRGCPSCGGSKKMTLEEFLRKAEMIHGAMSSHYDYSKILAIESNKTKVQIVCKLHGSFFMTPDKHLNSAQGCKKCKSVFSLEAIAWLEYVAKTEGIYIKHALRGGEERLDIDGVVYYVDGFCPDLHTVYQYHGDFYHGNPAVYNADDVNQLIGKTFGEIYQKTMRIEEMIKSQGFTVVTMWETDWKARCQNINLNPTEACQNPDYVCPTAAERKASNMKRSVEKQRQRIQSDPEYKKNRTEKQKQYMERNKMERQQFDKKYYVENRKKILDYQKRRAERRKNFA